MRFIGEAGNQYDAWKLSKISCILVFLYSLDADWRVALRGRTIRDRTMDSGFLSHIVYGTKTAGKDKDAQKGSRG